MILYDELENTRARIEADVYRALALIEAEEQSRPLWGLEQQQKLTFEELRDFLHHQRERGA